MHLPPRFYLSPFPSLPYLLTRTRVVRERLASCLDACACWESPRPPGSRSPGIRALNFPLVLRVAPCSRGRAAREATAGRFVGRFVPALKVRDKRECECQMEFKKGPQGRVGEGA